MSEELEEIVEEIVETVEEEAPEAPTHDQVQEERAAKGGWKPREDFIADGGEPDKWSTAEVFNVRGEFIDRMKHKDNQIKELGERMVNLNQFHAVTLEAQKKELEDRKAEYVRQGGEEGLEGVKNMDHQLNTLNQAETTQTVEAPMDPVYTAFNERHDYMKSTGPKHSHAMMLYNSVQGQGTPQQVVNYVEQEMSKAFPNEPRQKETVSMSEGGSKPGGFKKSSSKEPTLADISPVERKQLEAMGLTEKQMLQAVIDAGKDK